MTFIPTASPIQDIDRKSILLLGDHPTPRALQDGKKLDIVDAGVLQECLHMAGMTKSEVAYANVFPTKVNLAGLWHDKSKTFTPDAKIFVGAIKERIAQHDSRVIVSLGAVPTRALLERSDYTSIRGYPFPYGDKLVIPSLHPRDMVWANYVWRFYLSHDLHKAKAFATGAVRIQEPTIVICNTVPLVESLVRLLEKADCVAVDIEVNNYEVSCIGFATDDKHGFTVPFDQRWSEEDELRVWLLIAQVLENPKIRKVLQNGIFDVYFLWYRNNILIQGEIDDTMVSHSIIYPDFLKGLGFLGSLHTTMKYWKDEADFREGYKDEA